MKITSEDIKFCTTNGVLDYALLQNRILGKNNSMKITERNKKEAVNAVAKLKDNKVDEIIHNQVSYSLSLYVSSFFAEKFIHYITPQAKMELQSELNRQKKLHDKMLKITGLDRAGEEAEDVRMDVEDFISEVINKMNKALLTDKVGAMLEAIKYI